MSRRSARLLTGGYYNSDDDSESAIISYKETPVKIFKRRTGGRRTGSSRVSSSSMGPFTTITPNEIILDNDYAGIANALRTAEKRQTFVVPRYPPHASAPAPAPATTSGLPAEPGSPLRSPPFSTSGYSSSESECNGAAVVVKNPCTPTDQSMAPSPATVSDGCPFSISTLKFTLNMISLLCLICGVAFALLTSLSYLTPTLTPLVSNLYSNTLVRSLLTLRSPELTDYALLETKMNHMLVDIQQKNEKRIVDMEQQLNEDLKDVQNRMANLDTASQVRLEHDMAGLQSNFRTTTSTLRKRVEAQERLTEMLTQKVSVIPTTAPPSTPAAFKSTPITYMTLELEQAMKKWLNDNMPKAELQQSDDKPDPNKMADFALESQGAFVMKASESYHHQSACFSLFGIPLWYKTETPRTVLQGNPPLAGRCWPLKGNQGSLTVCLSHPVRITHVTIDHLPRENSPTGRVTSALQDFEVYGMNFADGEGTLLGSFKYQSNGESTQTFETPVHQSDGPVYRFVELRILSNWGQPAYTCLYRFRVHGQLPTVG